MAFHVRNQVQRSIRIKEVKAVDDSNVEAPAEIIKGVRSGSARLNPALHSGPCRGRISPVSPSW